MSRPKQATLYRMVMDDHVCPYGLKALSLLKRQGFDVEDHHLKDRKQTDVFKKKWEVETTPQIFIGGERIGGYDALRQHFGLSVPSDEEKRYTPVLVVFLMAALLSVAATGGVTIQTLEWFVAFSMGMLAMLKLRDIESFTTMFLGYDLLARRYVPYAYIYPFAEGLAAILMVAGGVFGLIAAPIALFIGSVGAISVIKAVYVDKRDLKCACVGGGMNVPLGFVSLSENLAMIAMGIWMIAKLGIS